MEGLVMRKVRERLCLIVCGGGWLGGDGGMEGRGPKLSSVGLIIIAGNLCVCLCVCVVGRETVRERE